MLKKKFQDLVEIFFLVENRDSSRGKASQTSGNTDQPKITTIL